MITDGLNALNVVAFLALGGGSALAALAIGAALLGRRPAVAGRLALGLVAGWTLYGGALLGASLGSRERRLAPGVEKHVCELDCHLAYSVVGVRSTESASGVSYVVTVRVRFDAATISPHRGMGPLSPNPRYAAIVDGRGRRYSAPTDGLTRPLTPGESYTTELAFALPKDARDLRLILGSRDPENLLIIGHENSFLHAKTSFRLTP